MSTEQPFQPNYAPVAPVNPEKNGLGLAAVILGPIGLLFAIIPLTGFIAVALGITGLILGLAGYSRVRKNKATNGKTAITGVILSLLALIIGVIGIVIVFQATEDLTNDLDCIGNSASVSECQDNN